MHPLKRSLFHNFSSLRWSFISCSTVNTIPFWPALPAAVSQFEILPLYVHNDGALLSHTRLVLHWKDANCTQNTLVITGNIGLLKLSALVYFEGAISYMYAVPSGAVAACREAAAVMAKLKHIEIWTILTAVLQNFFLPLHGGVRKFHTATECRCHTKGKKSSLCIFSVPNFCRHHYCLQIWICSWRLLFNGTKILV